MPTYSDYGSLTVVRRPKRTHNRKGAKRDPRRAKKGKG